MRQNPHSPVHPCKRPGLWFLVSSQSCAPITAFNFQTLSFPEKKPCTLQPSSSKPPASDNTPLLSVPTDVPILEISYQWDHTLDGCLWLASFTPYAFSRSLHVGACVRVCILSVAGGLFRFVASPPLFIRSLLMDTGAVANGAAVFIWKFLPGRTCSFLLGLHPARGF